MNKQLSVPGQQAIANLAQTMQACGQSMPDPEADPVSYAFMQAAAAKQIRDAMVPELLQQVKVMMDLGKSGIQTGFDREPNDEQLKTILTEALLIHRLRLFGGELVIMQTKGGYSCYASKDAIWRLLTTHPGITDVRYDTGEIEPAKGGKVALVDGWVSWKKDGKKQEIRKEPKGGRDYRIRLAVPERMSGQTLQDYLKGKAESKLWRQAYREATGSDLGVIDDPENPDDEIEGEIVTDHPSDTYADWQRDVQMGFESCEMVSDVDLTRDSLLGDLDDPDLAAETRESRMQYIETAAEQAKERIRNSRGERAN